MQRRKGPSRGSRTVVAIYARLDLARLDHQSQLPELKDWAATQQSPVRWYQDTTPQGDDPVPHFEQLLTDVRAGQVHTICIWRLDCLGNRAARAAGLIELVDELLACGVTFISLREGLDLTAQR
jgi:DNA invertase Pin-like site-specific DNA recombinase